MKITVLIMAISCLVAGVILEWSEVDSHASTTLIIAAVGALAWAQRQNSNETHEASEKAEKAEKKADEAIEKTGIIDMSKLKK